MHDDLTPHALGKIEKTTQELGRHLFEHLSDRRPTLIERRWWDDRLMQWAMHDESVKVQMFRFIDVLPMLHSNAAIIGHLHEYFHDVRAANLPAAVRLGMAVARPHTLIGRAVARAARRNALGQARRFIAGTTVAEVLAAARRERKLKRAFTLDVLGEAVTSELEADRYLQTYLDLIAGIAPTVNPGPKCRRSIAATVRRTAASQCVGEAFGPGQPIRPHRSGRHDQTRRRAAAPVAAQRRGPAEPICTSTWSRTAPRISRCTSSSRC